VTTPKSKKGRTNPRHGNNKENGSNDEDGVFQSPTPYWKVAMERGGAHSPRETRAAKKRRTGRSFCKNGTGSSNDRQGLMVFSPPDQAANAKREKTELERQIRER
jgi:hypothetical protein